MAFRLRVFVPFFVTVALAAPAGADPGFLPPTDKAVPAPIGKAASGVFAVLVVNPNSVREVPLQNYEALLRQKDFGSPFGLTLLRKEYDRCVAAKAKTCPFFDVKKQAIGSAFLTEDRENLWTAWHIVHNAYVAAAGKLDARWERKEKFVHLVKNPTTLVMALFDARGNLVFDTATGGDKATLELFTAEVPRGEELFSDAGIDFARIHLSKKLEGTGLVWSKKAPLVDDDVFVVGYPAKTTTRKEGHNAPDAPGDKLVVSRGKVLSAEKAMKKAAPKEDLDLEAAKYLNELLVFTDADATFASSGGPLLNGQGEVVGIAAAVMRSEKGEEHMHDFLASPRKKSIDEVTATLKTLRK